MADQYARQIGSEAPAERMVALSEAAQREGHHVGDPLRGGRHRLQEYTCPYYELAREYRAICDMEQGMIAQVVNQPVSGVVHLDRHHGCKFKIDTGDE